MSASVGIVLRNSFLGGASQYSADDSFSSFVAATARLPAGAPVKRWHYRDPRHHWVPHHVVPLFATTKADRDAFDKITELPVAQPPAPCIELRSTIAVLSGVRAMQRSR